MSKPSFRRARSSCGTQLIVARETSTACLSGERPKYDMSSLNIVITWYAIATSPLDEGVSHAVRRARTNVDTRIYVLLVCVCLCASNKFDMSTTHLQYVSSRIILVGPTEGS